MKHISILGSTGSIGCNTLKVVEHLGDIRVTAMAAGRNIARFIEQIVAFKPEIAACADDLGAEQLERALHNLGSFKPKILVGDEGLIAVATADRVDTVVSATVGAVGFVPTLRAIESGKRVALANKETLVMAGELMTAAAALVVAGKAPDLKTGVIVSQSAIDTSRAEKALEMLVKVSNS